MRTIPQRELRNHISRVLREVESGEYLRVTVDGRPVADLVPVGRARQTFIPWEIVEKILAEAPLDPAFAEDIKSATGGTIDELWPPES